ncbi:MAG: Flp pilus assembly protein CpaB [Bryobacteraceae bacterium]|jgi:pilus assembly protein CpaB
MHWDRRFAIVVGVSLIWAVLVSSAFYHLAGRSRAGERDMKPLVVAMERLPLGAVVRPDQVRLSRVPANLFPKGGFSRVEDVEGRPVVAAIEADEPLVEARVAQRGSGMGLAPMIPTGMRAASVRVNDVADVAGFILPGMHVDVLATGRADGHDDTITRTVLQDITVLSVGQTIQADAHNPSISAAVVTLLVMPDQAEALMLASTEGYVQLVLRNSTDRSTARTAGKQLHEIYVGAQAAPANAPGLTAEPQPRRAATAPVRLVAAPAPVAAPVNEMTIFSGRVRTVVDFNEEGYPVPAGDGRPVK